MSLSSRRPTQSLNINCTDCGVVTVRFESFVGDGPVFQMVGTKLSEILAVVSRAPDVVLCATCQEKRGSAETNRKQLQRERLLKQMELPSTTPQENVDRPARYPLKPEREDKASTNWLPRRAASNRERNTASQSFIRLYGFLTCRIDPGRKASLGSRIQSTLQF